MKNRSILKMFVICITNILFSIVMYTLHGISGKYNLTNEGYFLFKNKIEDNILKNLDNKDTLTIIIKIFVAILIMLTFPVIKI